MIITYGVWDRFWCDKGMWVHGWEKKGDITIVMVTNIFIFNAKLFFLQIKIKP